MCSAIGVTENLNNSQPSMYFRISHTYHRPRICIWHFSSSKHSNFFDARLSFYRPGASMSCPLRRTEGSPKVADLHMFFFGHNESLRFDAR